MAPAIYDTATGELIVLLSASAYASVTVDFTTNAIPVVGDFDGDQQADPVVYDPAAQTWTARPSAFGYAEVTMAFGAAEATPLAADFDGDRLADPALYAESAGFWQVRLSRSQYGEVTLQDFGGTGSQPIVGDFDGDGASDPALYQAANGEWLVKLSGSAYASAAVSGFGGTNYLPVVGDYDHDGLNDFGVYGLSTRTLSVRYAAGNDLPGTISQTNVLQSNRILFNAAKAPDESVGILYCEELSRVEYGPLYYEAVDRVGGVLADEPVPLDGEVWTPLLGDSVIPLLYDSGGTAHTFFAFPHEAMTHVYRAGGSWTNEALPVTNSLNGDFLGRLGPGDAFHLLSSSTSDGNLLLFYATNQRGDWEGQTLTIPLGTLYFTGKDLAVDSAGNAHFVISMQDHLGENVTWPGYLYYLSAETGWNLELVASRANNSWDAGFAEPSVAVKADGQPAIATRLRYNVLTGSDALSQLFYAERTGAAAWSSAILADTADNYFGSDGGHFTGVEPKLAFDRLGRAQIIFSDLASSHVGGYEMAEVGQIRRAIQSAGTWTITTLFAQSAEHNEGLTDKYLFLSADNDGFDIVARLYPDYTILRFSNQRPSTFTFY
ncbi:MAG: hypothetical protein HYV35_03535 [Lentisphaerae bacterium]|nr:hypothetical protein [Lentisphaerota bacterium]